MDDDFDRSGEEDASNKYIAATFNLNNAYKSSTYKKISRSFPILFIEYRMQKKISLLLLLSS